MSTSHRSATRALQGTAGVPQPGSETSRRNAPQSTVTLQMLSWVLLVYLGLLLGTILTSRASQLKLRRQAEEASQTEPGVVGGFAPPTGNAANAHAAEAHCPKRNNPMTTEPGSTG